MDGDDVFGAVRRMYKYYKRRDPPPNLSSVIDFETDNFHVKVTRSLVAEDVANSLHDAELKRLGLKRLQHWTISTLPSHPGLLFVANPFTADGQQLWSARAVTQWPAAPHKTNLPTAAPHLASVAASAALWRQHALCTENAADLNKLRWTTMGYHHNWDTKMYNERDLSPMPGDLCDLSELLCSVALRCARVGGGSGCGEFSAQAAIVNYYHERSSLAPHCDESEMAITAPLVSISFGRTAVFLISGHAESEDGGKPSGSAAPAAMYIRSGDVIIMAGQSRLSCHAVPCLLADSDPERWRCEEHSGPTAVVDSMISRYLRARRINVSVRRVYCS